MRKGFYSNLISFAARSGLSANDESGDLGGPAEVSFVS